MGVFSFKNDADNLGVLDLVPEQAAAAYSVRKLSKDYNGPAIRVRRSSDNVEQDIYFDGSGNLDISTLLTFTSAADGLVTTWYDQSGSGRNATQTVAANQPKIVNAGALVTENGKPAVDFDGVDDIFVVSDTNIRSFYSVQAGFGNDILSTTQNRVVYANTLFDWQEKNFDAVLSIDTTNQALISFNDSLDGLFSHNGSTYTNIGVDYIQGSEVLNRIGGNDNGVLFWDGTIQEFIFYNTDQSTNRTKLESNMNKYFKIY